MAHRCLAVDEIVRAIVAYLVWNQKRASAVALACCSKSLEEPALGEVWRNLSSLIPLVKCFPPEIWEKDSRYLFFKRAPTQQEWIRFQKQYASKVRHLSKFSYNFNLSSTALHVLQLYSSDRPLLPNLISLEWSSDETRFPFLSLFISSSLKSIAIRAPTKASAVLPPILQKLSKLSSDIRDIEINLYGGDNQLYHASMEEASSQLSIHCNRLRKFNIHSPISASALRHLIQLPSLEDLSLVVDPFQLPSPLPTLVFPSLRTLYVECNGDPTWLKLLPSIENPVLTSITVKCPGSGIERFMETFQQTMGGCGVQKSLQELGWTSREFFDITPQMIASNLSFKNLTVLIMRSYCTVDLCKTFGLTDDDIDLLTKAMPCLQCLNLGDIPCGFPSQITLKSLYTISRRCTRLNDLKIHFDPAMFVNGVGVRSEPWGVALGISDIKTHSSDVCPITMISVGAIPLPAGYNTSSVLALGLLGIFPRLESIDYDNGDWHAVEQLVGVFRLIGGSAFREG